MVKVGERPDFENRNHTGAHVLLYSLAEALDNASDEMGVDATSTPLFPQSFWVPTSLKHDERKAEAPAGEPVATWVELCA